MFVFGWENLYLPFGCCLHIVLHDFIYSYYIYANKLDQTESSDQTVSLSSFTLFDTLFLTSELVRQACSKFRISIVSR